MSDLLSRTALRVRGYHLDGYGHVNNARYLEFMEDGRWAFFDQQPQLMAGLHQVGRAFVVVNLNIDYRNAAVLGDDLAVLTGITRVGERSGICHHRIIRRRDSATVVSADLTFVLLDMKANQAATIDGEVRDALGALTVGREAFDN
ncbi:acyl-CoA thioesterase [Vreelandella jeotgali]|uniref:acyl-CoA thioesterase n=1 Tax=Vreelandella jeotgali TaxID=553386 RepID=UPI000344920D|nr:thioesterase family protein [Halomonas jeotgali]